MTILKLGSTGPEVAALQQRLQQRGFDPGAINGQFGPSTESALKEFQQSVGLQADGVAGPNTIAALQMPSVPSNVTAEIVRQMFPNTPALNIRFHLPFVLEGLRNAQLTEKNMVLMALATIRAETESFQPIEEFVSSFNTAPGGQPFCLYDNRQDLGNTGPPDGALFKGRGFVQLTGRANYREIGQSIGLGDQLVQNPDRATDPDIAAQILAVFLSMKEASIRQALDQTDLAAARKLVNGGTHGLAAFQDAFQRGQDLIPDPVKIEIDQRTVGRVGAAIPSRVATA